MSHTPKKKKVNKKKVFAPLQRFEDKEHAKVVIFTAIPLLILMALMAAQK